MTETFWIALQGISTLFLVGVTAVYVRLVRRQIDESAKAVKAAERSAEAAEQSVAMLSADARARRVSALQSLVTAMRAHSVAASNWADKADQGRSGVGRPASADIIKLKTLSSLTPLASGVGGDVGLTVRAALDAAGAANESVALLIQVQGSMDTTEEKIAIKKMRVAFGAAREAFEDAARTCEGALDDVHDTFSGAHEEAGSRGRGVGGERLMAK